MSSESDLLSEISIWAMSHGIKNLSQRQGKGLASYLGVAEHDGSKWKVWCNASDEKVSARVSEKITVEILRWQWYVEYNGWPAGFLDAGGGTFAAGEGANPERFVAALRACKGEQE